jgi:phosphatidylglycerophosphatase A
MRRAAILLATAFGIGRFPVAPATALSLVMAVVFAILAAAAPGALAPVPLGIATLLLLPLAIAASGEAEKELGHDAHPIVIDEVMGMLLSVWGIARLSAPRPWLFLGAAFLLFRLFDILKPFPIRQSQRLPGGWGVVVDDVLAGIATNLALRILILAGAPF